MAQILVMALIVTFFLQAGLSTDPKLIESELKRPSPLARDVLFLLVLEPILAVVVVWALHPSVPITVALVLLSVVGVAPIAARGAGKGKGDVTLALVLTIILGLVCVFTAVPLARWLLRYEGHVDFHPVGMVLKLIALQAVPLGLGLAIRAATPHAATAGRIVRALNLGLFLAVVVLILVPHAGELAKLGWPGVAAGILFSGVAASIGLLLGGGPDRGEGRTLATLANTPNIGLALAIVAAAGATPLVTATVLGMFLLRVLVGLMVQQLLARRHGGAAVA